MQSAHDDLRPNPSQVCTMPFPGLDSVQSQLVQQASQQNLDFAQQHAEMSMQRSAAQSMVTAGSQSMPASTVQPSSVQDFSAGSQPRMEVLESQPRPISNNQII